jgi:hypothetical protein
MLPDVPTRCGAGLPREVTITGSAGVAARYKEPVQIVQKRRVVQRELKQSNAPVDTSREEVVL